MAPDNYPEASGFPEASEESQDLYEHYRIIVDKGQGPVRMDKFLMDRIENASRNKIQQAARAGNILVNGEAVKPSYKIKPLDVISIVLSQPPRDTEIYPEDIPLDIIYEDEDLLLVDKPAGMVVHPAYGNFTGTMVNALAHHLQFVSPNRQEGRLPMLVHRIDKDTTGIILVAKNELAQARLARQFYLHTIDRRYHALVWGTFDQDEGTIVGNIIRNPRDRKLFWVSPDDSAGKHAVTHFRVLEPLAYVTLVECRLETGRTHQIRVHFQHIRHPLFGDETYGGRTIVKGTSFSKYRQFVENCFTVLPRQALHARSLSFRHPSSGKEMSFDSDLPDDFQQVLSKWRRYASGNTGQ